MKDQSVAADQVTTHVRSVPAIDLCPLGAVRLVLVEVIVQLHGQGLDRNTEGAIKTWVTPAHRRGHQNLGHTCTQKGPSKPGSHLHTEGGHTCTQKGPSKPGSHLHTEGGHTCTQKGPSKPGSHLHTEGAIKTWVTPAHRRGHQNLGHTCTQKRPSKPGSHLHTANTFTGRWTIQTWVTPAHSKHIYWQMDHPNLGHTCTQQIHLLADLLVQRPVGKNLPTAWCPSFLLH